LVKEELSHVQEWLVSNQNTLNVKKYNFIIFKSHKKPFTTKLNNQEIIRVDKAKFLGSTIDQHLTGKHHTDHVQVTKSELLASSVGYTFISIKNFLKMLYYSLTYPYLHGNIVWAKNYPKRLEKFLNSKRRC